ncbi:MAG: IS982 family transposase [Clostridium sp.]|nr:IS982 family transposase [Clostridium sp.]MCI7442923.1 IS982 family transposase [Clostridium sp.]MDY4544204.1 IS982 family transposase [Bacilli bacterium]
MIKMLEFTYYNTEKINDLKDLFTIIFVLVDDVYNEIIPSNIKNRRNISDSKLSDSEIISISIVGEAITIDSEKAWFFFVKKNFKDLFPNIGDRTRFNRTKRNLFMVIKEIQKYFSNLPMFLNDDIRIIDSMPIPVCKFARSYFNKSFKDISSYGYCASKKETYFGLKLHALITTSGFITDFFLTSANVDDRAAVHELIEEKQLIKIIADKGYVDETLKEQLKKEKDILLISLKRKNSKNPLEKQLRNTLSKTRRRVETSFSQLAEQFNINKVLAKSKWGLMLRITLKILAHNILFIINNILKNNKVAQIKQLVFG